MNAKMLLTLEMSSSDMFSTELSSWNIPWLLSHWGHFVKMCHTSSGVSHCAQAGAHSSCNRYLYIRRVWPMQRFVITSSFWMGLKEDYATCTVGFTSHNPSVCVSAHSSCRGVYSMAKLHMDVGCWSLITWQCSVRSCFFGSGISGLIAGEASMAWHPTKHNTTQ